MILNSIIGLLVALGILVTVHEYGHYWVARRNGVKVLRFSIGFGQPIWRKTNSEGTEFVVAWIPLGGYVKMLDEREGDVEEHERHLSFNSKRPAQKIAIALAGPLANFLFAVFAFTLMYMVGVRDLTALVNEPIVGSPSALAGLEARDLVLRIDGTDVSGFTGMNMALAARVGDSGVIRLDVERNGRVINIEIPIERWLADQSSPRLLAALGLRPYLPPQPVTIGEVVPGEAAQRDGLRAGDVIVRVGEQRVADWNAWVQTIQQSPQQPLELTVLRNQSTLQIEVTPNARNVDGDIQGYIGAAAKVPEWPEDQLMIVRYAPWTAVWRGIQETQNMIVLSYEMIGKMITGAVSLRQVGGPITMAQMAGQSVESGFEVFVGYLAMISISLGIVNLLPIPVLDGGHVVIHSIEALRKKALSDRAQLIAVQIGLLFIFALMALAFVNDIGRLF